MQNLQVPSQLEHPAPLASYSLLSDPCYREPPCAPRSFRTLFFHDLSKSVQVVTRTSMSDIIPDAISLSSATAFFTFHHQCHDAILQSLLSPP
ncbi:hypothetical protein [Rubritalea tangerina]|uniref:hypothetical protein n=1 Tax=Rubritalea tangerina TaxID=430798 RepID=UPI0036193BD7